MSTCVSARQYNNNNIRKTSVFVWIIVKAPSSCNKPYISWMIYNSKIEKFGKGVSLLHNKFMNNYIGKMSK